jgi:hypothetical protein
MALVVKCGGKGMTERYRAGYLASMRLGCAAILATTKKSLARMILWPKNKLLEVQPAPYWPTCGPYGVFGQYVLANMSGILMWTGGYELCAVRIAEGGSNGHNRSA